jgi:hypothetical protein
MRIIENKLSRREVMGTGFALIAAAALPGKARAELQETPAFRDKVAGGKLPKIEERVPIEPAVAELEATGTVGGELRMLMAGPKDTRMMVVLRKAGRIYPLPRPRTGYSKIN